MRNTFLLLATGLTCTAFSQSTALAWSAVVDCGTPTDGNLRPRIAINAQQKGVVVWGRSDLGSCVATVGDEVGFAAAQQLNPPGTELMVADWTGPAIDAQGDDVWAVFKAMPEELAPCYAVSSSDGGTTWSDTLRIDPYDSLVSRFPFVAVNANGEPVAGYMQFDGGYEHPRQVVRSMMGGSFMPVAQVSTPFAPGEVCDCCTGEVAAGGDAVVALYRNAGSNIRVIHGASSNDGGSTFPVGGLLDNTAWAYDQCPSSGPDAYIAGDSVRYVWMSGQDNGRKVFIGSAHVAALAPGAQRNVHGGLALAVQQNFPRIAGHGDTLGVVWEQYSSGQREILFSWSVTGINGLSAPDTVNIDLSGSQKTPDIAFKNGVFHIVWSDIGADVVRYRKATLVNTTGLQVIDGEDYFRIWPNPVSDRINVRYDAPVEGWLLVDAMGRIAARYPGTARTFVVNGLAAGSYWIEALREDGSVVVRAPLSIAVAR